MSDLDYRKIITIEPGKRFGKPCIRGLRITVYDVLEYLASGMSVDEILDDFPKLTKQDIQACFAYLADREIRTLVIWLRLFFDTNLSNKLVKKLNLLYPNSTHAEFENLDEAMDLVIWDFCKKNNFIIITKDKDYFDLSSMYKSPPKVILIKSGNCPTSRIIYLLENFYNEIQTFFESDKMDCMILH